MHFASQYFFGKTSNPKFWIGIHNPHPLIKISIENPSYMIVFMCWLQEKFHAYEDEIAISVGLILVGPSSDRPNWGCLKNKKKMYSTYK